MTTANKIEWFRDTLRLELERLGESDPRFPENVRPFQKLEVEYLAKQFDRLFPTKDQGKVTA